MPFIKLKFLASGLPCISVLKTCGTLIRLRSMYMQLEDEPRSSYTILWDHFDLLSLPRLPFLVLWLEKGVNFSFLALLCTPCKCNCLGTKRQEDVHRKQQWGSSLAFEIRVLLSEFLGACLASTASILSIATMDLPVDSVRENGKIQRKFWIFLALYHPQTPLFLPLRPE